MTAASTLNIYQRLHAVMQEVDYIQKEKRQGMRYSIVSHDAVTAKVRPLMVKHGVVYFPTNFKLDQVGNRTQLACDVVFQNIDDRADFMCVSTAGYGIDDQDKGPGKAISYAVKYALLKALGLETGDDPDNDQDVQHKPAVASKTVEPEQPRPSDHPSVNGTPGASKAAFRDPFDRMTKAIRNTASVTALKALWKDNAADIDEWPPEFVDIIKIEFGDRRKELEKALAA